MKLIQRFQDYRKREAPPCVKMLEMRRTFSPKRKRNVPTAGPSSSSPSCAPPPRKLSRVSPGPANQGSSSSSDEDGLPLNLMDKIADDALLLDDFEERYIL